MEQEEVLEAPPEEGTDEESAVEVDEDEAFPQVNPKIYQGVESLLFHGFLTIAAEINDIPFVFKTLNHRELEQVNWVAGGNGASPRYYNTFIAHSVFMLDGVNVLPKRDKTVREICQFLESSPDSVRNKVVQYLFTLNQRGVESVLLTQAYAMERYSRLRWAEQKGLSMLEVSGIPGVEKLGLNYAQLTWRLLNSYQDMREAYDRDWDNAKFIGSCFAGKEIKKVYNQDKQRKKAEKSDQYAQKDKIIQKALLGVDVKDATQTRGRIQMAVTVAELTEQVRKAAAGEKDWHDEVVAAAENQALRAYEAKQANIARMVQEASKIEEPILPSQGFSLQEVQQRAERFKQTQAQLAASRVIPMDESALKQEEAVLKHLTYDSSIVENAPKVGR